MSDYWNLIFLLEVLVCSILLPVLIRVGLALAATEVEATTTAAAQITASNKATEYEQCLPSFVKKKEDMITVMFHYKILKVDLH